MNSHREAIQKTLEAFCRDYTGRESGWLVETWYHPITGSVQSVTVMPEFAKLGVAERVEVIGEYLKTHLPREHDKHLALTLAMTPEEYEKAERVPLEPVLRPAW